MQLLMFHSSICIMWVKCKLMLAQRAVDPGLLHFCEGLHLVGFNYARLDCTRRSPFQLQPKIPRLRLLRSSALLTRTVQNIYTAPPSQAMAPGVALNRFSGQITVPKSQG